MQRFIFVLTAMTMGCASNQGNLKQERATNSTIDRQLANELVNFGRLADDANRPKPAPQVAPQAAPEKPRQRKRTTRRVKRSRKASPRTSNVQQPRRVTTAAAKRLPCFLDRPSRVPVFQTVAIRNGMRSPIGLRLNGKSLVVIGEQVDTGHLLPGGVPTYNGLLPPGETCWTVPTRFGGSIRVNAVQYAINAYNGQVTVLSKSTQKYGPRRVRSRGPHRSIGFDRFSW